VMVAPGDAQTTVNLGTAGNAAQWLMTAAGASAAPAFQDGGSISITSNGLLSGTFVAGGSLASFNGFWLADNTFSIPAGATGVSLSFSGLNADDRAVLQLNGATVGNVGISGGTGLPTPGPGLMRFTESGADSAFTFTSTQSGTLTFGFNIGGTNTLRLIVNNTGAGLAASTHTFLTGTDNCNASVTATLTYTPGAATVPAVSTGVLLALAGLLAVFSILAMRGSPRQRRT